MENFSVLAREEIIFDKSFLYDNGAKLTDKIIEFESNRIEISFSAIFLKNLTFDLFLISDNQTLYRINKFKKIIEPIGSIEDKILSISTGNDKIVIITDKEVLLFNNYFDLEKHSELSSIYKEYSDDKQFILNLDFKIVFGDEYFAITTPDSMIVLNFDLNVLGIYKERILGAVFIKNYNKFACISSKDKNIKFIEPNCLEHGDPLQDYASNIHSICIEDSQIILLDKKDHIDGYYQKNFFWYKKFSIRGSFFGTENNSIIIQKELILQKYYVYHEKATKFVINDRHLYYTNFNRAIIPPPFYYKDIVLNSNIFCYSFVDHKLLCGDQTGISLFSIDEFDKIIENMRILYENISLDVQQMFEVLLIKDNAYLRTQSGIFKLEILSSKLEFIMKSDDVLKMYCFWDEIAILRKTGVVVFKNQSYKFEFDNKNNFDLQFSNDKIYLLNSGNLQSCQIIKQDTIESIISSTTSLNINPNCENLTTAAYHKNITFYNSKKLFGDVSSFLIYENYLLYIIRNDFCVFDLVSNEKNTSYAEEGLKILAVKDNSVIFSTRFGSLETVTNKLFSAAIVRRLIESHLIYEAAVKCDLNHLSFEIFLEKNNFSSEFIYKFNDSQALSFFNCLKLPKQMFLLECETFERLDMNFDIEFVTRDNPFKIINSECISNDVAKKFFVGFDFDYFNDQDLKHAEFLRESINIPNYIDNNCSMNNINSFLNALDIEKHFSTLVNVFIILNRIDLCFYLPNIQKVIKILQTKLSPESICKASILTFNTEKIILTHRLCQKDYASFISFFNSSENRKFSVYHYLENKKLALYHLADYNLKNNLSIDEIVEYAISYKLIDCLALFTYHNLFNFSFYPFVAKHKEPLDSFYLYMKNGDFNKAIEISKENLFWRESLKLDSSVKNCSQFILLLINASKYSEAGEIAERFINDFIMSIKLYLKGKSIQKAFDLYKNSDFNDILSKNDNFQIDYLNTINSNEIKNDKLLGQIVISKEDVKNVILQTCIKYSKDDCILLNNLIETFQKYKNRLEHVRARLNENMHASQTTFSYSSMRSTQKALIKDRPGGIYENEYVMNKIYKTVIEICQMRNQAQEIFNVFDEFGQIEDKQQYYKIFEPLNHSLRSDIDEIWNFQRTDVDINLPIIPKPEINNFFD